MDQSQNVIFWGSGATKALGMRTTADQAKFIRLITSTRPLEERIIEALNESDVEPWHSALFDLITILGDSPKAYGSIHYVEPDQREAMRRNWQQGASCEELDRRIIELRLIYDWPALKSAVQVLSG